MERLLDVSVAFHWIVLTPRLNGVVALVVIVTAKMSVAVAVPIDTLGLDDVTASGTVSVGAVVSLIVML